MGYFGIPFRNGVPIGLGSIVGFGAPQEFSPSELFLGGTAGAWYDPSDLSTLFTTSAGTTQCAMPGQGSAVSVGLMLDKSQGLVLGPELVTNGDFSGGTTTGWTPQSAALSVIGGQLSVVPSTTFGYAYQTLTTVVGTTYRLTFSFDQSTAATARYFVGTSVGDGSIIGLTTVSGVGSVSRYFTATTTTTFIHFGAQNSSGLQALFDNISVKALPGNHAIAFNDTTARPELRARVNLLTYSEEFDNGVWTKAAVGVTANAAIAPNGTTTADALVENSGASSRFGAFFTTAITPSIAHTFSVAVKNFSGTRFARIVLNTANSTVFACVDVNPRTGAITQTLNSGLSGVSSSSTDLGNGWYRVSITAIGAVNYVTVALITGSAVPAGIDFGYEAYTGDGTSGIYIWGADLRPANIGANVPAYQRIADANTYDTSGFPLYLLFEGAVGQRGMYTPANLNLSGTDKVAVFAGVRRNATVTQFPVEFSAQSDANNSTFGIGNDSGGAEYFFNSRGTTLRQVIIDNAAYNAPVSNVVTLSADIAAPSLVARLNGTQVGSNTSSQGTGNYGTYPLYIGSRGNSSLWFQGHLHSLIIAGSAVSAGNISATEQWVAGKTGIQI